MPLIICAISSLASWGKPHAETVCMLGAPANDSEFVQYVCGERAVFKAEAGSSALATRFYQLVQTIVFSNRLRPLLTQQESRAVLIAGSHACILTARSVSV